MTFIIIIKKHTKPDDVYLAQSEKSVIECIINYWNKFTTEPEQYVPKDGNDDRCGYHSAIHLSNMKHWENTKEFIKTEDLFYLILTEEKSLDGREWYEIDHKENTTISSYNEEDDTPNIMKNWRNVFYDLDVKITKI